MAITQPKRSPVKIREDIEDAFSEGFSSLRIGIDDLLKSVTEDVKELVEISNLYVKRIEKSKLEWKEINEEVGKLKEGRDLLKDREGRINAKADRVNEEEGNLVKLHEVLENKRKLLDKREQDIKIKERRKGI